MITQAINIDAIISEQVSEGLFEGGFGFEKENVRVDLKGRLAQTPHPKVFGNKTDHPYITTDFSESQVEMITPVRSTIDEALGFLETLHDEVSINLSDELLWPQSAPPILPDAEEDIPIARFDAKWAEMEQYRLYLAQEYGRKKQLLSGVHFNVSFSDGVLRRMFKASNSKKLNYAQFREQVYFKTLRNFKRYRWFLIALLGNSPVVHRSYVNECVNLLPKLKDDTFHLSKAGSMRNGMCGYRNKENLCLNYNSLGDYRQSIDKAINEGLISQAKENYASIRVKTINEREEISHLEVRLLDLNPFVKAGVDIHDARIIHTFLVYCLLKPEPNALDYKTQEIAYINHERAASLIMDEQATIINDDGQMQALQSALTDIVNEIKELTGKLLDRNYQQSMSYLEDLVRFPENRPAVRFLKELEQNDFIQWNLNKANQYLKESQQTSYNFYGLKDMELSTQLLLRAAMLRGISFDIMDRSENFIHLYTAAKSEYVMQATRTSLDNYASVLLMENKVMTKKVLQASGLNSPEGQEYYEIDNALRCFNDHRNQAIVIKPKSTNFGLGISILKANDDQSMYEQAIRMAFQFDNAILIEKFISGKEYRMFIINDELVGILHRVPANVIGDGESSIARLIAKKNQDPLRGKGYKTPLEKIEMGEAEAMFLETQALDFNSVPAKNQQVFLRENSNISTGGDSIDFTDEVHETYKQLAIEAAKALNVKVTGLDMMIDNIYTPANSSNYSIIEMNFNPAIHIHCHPFKGKNRRLNEKMLDALGF